MQEGWLSSSTLFSTQAGKHQERKLSLQYQDRKLVLELLTKADICCSTGAAKILAPSELAVRY